MMPSDMWVNRVLGHILLIRGLGLAIPAHIRLQRKVGKKKTCNMKEITQVLWPISSEDICIKSSWVVSVIIGRLQREDT